MRTTRQRLARSSADADLFGYIAEAKTALNRALEVCNRSNGRSRTRSRRASSSAWQLRRILRALDGIRGVSPFFDESDPDLAPEGSRKPLPPKPPVSRSD